MKAFPVTDMKWYARRITDHGFVYQMEHAGYKAKLMRAERLTGEHSHRLPPGEPIPVFPLACVPGAPKEWVREAGSYVVPVDSGWGLWLDWTMNDSYNTAILASIKGMNPWTGRKMESLQLEQYADKCPVHDTPFAHGRHCQECGFEWPAQNYITQDSGPLWVDGFRQPDGTTRQFYFTDEDKKDIASLVIGKENTVPAFGFAFFKPKNPRTPPAPVYSRSYYSKAIGSSWGNKKIGCSSSGSHYYGDSTVTTQSLVMGDCVQDNEPQMMFAAGVQGPMGPEGSCGDVCPTGVCGELEQEVKTSGNILRGVRLKSKSVGVGAGAKINQPLKQDSLGVDGWKPEPTAIIRLYFAFEEQFSEMVANGGILELKNEPEGFLKGLPVG